MANAEFANQREFIEKCEAAGVKPTSRQASKFRRKTGAVFQITERQNTKIHVPKEARWEARWEGR